MSASSRLRQIQRLSAAERRVLAQAVVLLPVAALGVKLAGLRRMQAWLALPRRGGTSRPLQAAMVARMVSIAQRHGPYRARCLATAVTLQSLLGRIGIATELRLGVRKCPGGLEAHAWIEHDGVALMERGDARDRFEAFDKPISPSRR